MAQLGASRITHENDSKLVGRFKSLPFLLVVGWFFFCAKLNLVKNLQQNNVKQKQLTYSKKVFDSSWKHGVNQFEKLAGRFAAPSTISAQQTKRQRWLSRFHLSHKFSRPILGVESNDFREFTVNPSSLSSFLTNQPPNKQNKKHPPGN